MSTDSSRMIRTLRDNHALIMQWAKGLTHEQMQSFDFDGWKNGLLLNPLMVREDLFTPEIRPLFVNDHVRQVVYIDIAPRAVVPEHNHYDMSYYMVDASGGLVMYPFEGRRYRTTHFTIEAPADRANAYLHIRGKRHYWTPGHFEEFDVVYNDHYAVNDTDEHIRIIYIDYYPG